MMTVGVPRGGVCEGVCGDSCEDDDEEEGCGEGHCTDPPPLPPTGRRLPSGPPITSGFTPLIRALLKQTIRWAATAAAAAAAAPPADCIRWGSPAATCWCTSLFTRNRMAASRLLFLSASEAGCIRARACGCCW